MTFACPGGKTVHYPLLLLVAYIYKWYQENEKLEIIICDTTQKENQILNDTQNPPCHLCNTRKISDQKVFQALLMNSAGLWTFYCKIAILMMVLFNINPNKLVTMICKFSYIISYLLWLRYFPNVKIWRSIWS